MLSGGEKRKSEKARLRKGVHVLVATPGRLLDHLKGTTAFNTAGLRTLVLDEADRLLDLGFDVQVKDIMRELQARAKVPPTARSLPWQSVLVSATLSPSLRSLVHSVVGADAPILLVDASLGSDNPVAMFNEVGMEGPADAGTAADVAAAVKASTSSVRAGAGARGRSTATTEEEGDEKDVEGGGDGDGDEREEEEEELMEAVGKRKHDKSAGSASALASALSFSAPTTLSQTYMLVPLKWRLVTMIAAIHDAFKQHRRGFASAVAGVHQPDVKILLFLSTTHAVDFHFHLFALILPRLLPKSRHGPFAVQRLHGNMDHGLRVETFRAFAAADSGLLIATDVASRGLDLPRVDLIIQADAPTDTSDYVHRVGRTARRGEQGAAILFLQPTEAAYAEILTAAGLAITPASTAPILASLTLARPPLEAIFPPPPAPPEGSGKPTAGGHRGGAGLSAAAAAALAAVGVKPAVARGDARGGAEAGGAEDARDGEPSVPTRVRHLLEACENARAIPNEAGVARRAELNAVLWQTLMEEAVLRPLFHVASTSTTATSLAPVAGGDSLLELGRDAFQSFVRAYATHERSLRHIFHPRTLHLGHAAKAFALRETPTVVVARSHHGSDGQTGGVGSGQHGPASAKGGSGGGGKKWSARDHHWDLAAGSGSESDGEGVEGAVRAAAALGGKRRRVVTEYDAF